jgi:hypothetical protein
MDHILRMNGLESIESFINYLICKPLYWISSKLHDNIVCITKIDDLQNLRCVFFELPYYLNLVGMFVILINLHDNYFLGCQMDSFEDSLAKLSNELVLEA